MGKEVKHEIIPITKELYAIYRHNETGHYLCLPIIGIYATYSGDEVTAVAVEVDNYGNICRVGQRDNCTMEIGTRKVGLCTGI